MDMEMDLQNEEDEDESILKLKLAGSELAMLVASQEVDKYKRECVLLKETVSRLEEDSDILRKREHRDAQTIRNLLRKIERHEREFSDKLAELTMRNWDLEWALRTKGDRDSATEKRKCKPVKVEKCRVEKGFENGNVNETPKAVANQVEKHDFVVVDSDGDSDDDEDGIPLSKKRILNVGKKDSGSSLNHSFDRMPPCGFPSIGTKGISATQVLKDTKETSAEGVQGYPRRNVKNQNCQRAYTGRIASNEQKVHALNKATLFQRNLMSCNPSCLKQMTPSHVSGGFWLQLPGEFCKENLPADEHKIILEDEKGVEYAVKYFGNRTAFSGGWRGFSIAHNLELHDVLIFELCEPAKLKVYIIKAVTEPTEDIDDKIAGEYFDGTSKMANNIGYWSPDVDLSDFNKNLQKLDMQINLKE